MLIDARSWIGNGSRKLATYNVWKLRCMVTEYEAGPYTFAKSASCEANSAKLMSSLYIFLSESISTLLVRFPIKSGHGVSNLLKRLKNLVLMSSYFRGLISRE
jgi:hypothetical protein